MKKIFKNMIPYWKSILVIVAVLVIQAYCDLALPAYTADIIDVGIQNKGIEHILPQEMTSEEYENAQLFMTKEEKVSRLIQYLKNENRSYDTLAEPVDSVGKRRLLRSLMNVRFPGPALNGYMECLSNKVKEK